MVETMSITEARRRFLSLVDEVSKGTTKVMVTKHGRPAAMLVNADEFFQMRETLDVLLRSPEVEAMAEGLRQLQERKTREK